MKKIRALKNTLAVVLIVLSAGQMAYLLRTTSELTPTLWQPQDLPIHFEIWKGFSDPHPSILPGSHPMAALREALSRWIRVSSLSATVAETSVSESRRDGVNLVTIADTANNRSRIGEFLLGISQIWLSDSRILETDIILNPRYPWSTREDAGQGAWNILQVAQHELGHCLGLAHSIDRSSTMYFQGGTFAFDFNRLSWDDIAGINSGYPLPGIGRITGSIRGRVTKNASPVYGAFVVAVDEDGLLMSSALTNRQGHYQIKFLPPGRYSLYVEPLDGPTTPLNLGVEPLDTNAMDAGFLPQFLNHSPFPSLKVAGGSTLWANFQVVPGSSRLDPAWTRVDDDPFDSGPFSVTPAFASRGSEVHFGIAGDGVSSLAAQSGVSFLGSHLRTDRVSRSAENSSGIHFKWYPLEVSSDAPDGAYTAVLSDLRETGIMSGVLQVHSAHRFTSRFAQFAHQTGKLRSEILLINRDFGRACEGAIWGLAGGGQAAGIDVHPLKRQTDGSFQFSIEPASVLLLSTQGPDSFEGSLHIEADCDLCGNIVIDSEAGAAGLVPSRPLHAFTAPVETNQGGVPVDTGIAITSFDKRPAEIFLQVYDEDGTPLGNRTLDLDGWGHTAFYITDFFSGLPTAFRGTIGVTANREIGGAVIRIWPGSLTTLPVIENRIARRHFFALFAHDPLLSSELLLVNPNSMPAENVQVTFRNAEGRAAPLHLNGEGPSGEGKTFRIPARGSLTLNASGSPRFTGSVEVASDFAVGGLVLFHSPETGSAGVGESLPATRLVAPIDRDLTRGKDTGLAVLNTEDRVVSLSLTVRNHDGTIRPQPAKLQLAPYQQLVRFPNDEPLDLGLPSRFLGSIWIEADGEVALTVIRQSPNVLTTFPALSLEEGNPG